MLCQEPFVEGLQLPSTLMASTRFRADHSPLPSVPIGRAVFAALTIALRTSAIDVSRFGPPCVIE